MTKLLLLVPLCFASLTMAQTNSATPTTQVLALLQAPSHWKLDQIQKTMPAEIRATAELYLQGHIAQWFSRSDGRGVVFILNCKSVEEAKALLDKLPLVTEHGAQFEYIALSPLRPLRFLLAAPQPSPPAK
ncbi:MAG: hypothetical protein NW208_10050 [Bryobacter sp.]|nr:hypothetical protein [Bryobacter sp.]